MTPQPAGPPLEKALRAGADADESEVEDPGAQHRQVADLEAVIGYGREHVRREDDAPVGCQAREIVDGVEHLDIGVEVQDRVRAFRQQTLQQQRLHRRRQLGDVVQEGLPPPLRRVGDDVFEPERSKQAGVRRLGGAVDHQHRDLGLRMYGGEGLREDPRVRQVIAGDDGAGLHDDYSPYWSCRCAGERWPLSAPVSFGSPASRFAISLRAD